MTVAKRFFLALLSVLILSSAAAGQHYAAYVFDGDTIRLKNGRIVRYLGIDAPEIGRDGNKDALFAREARDLNRKTVLNAGLRLVYDKEKTDRYGRRLAYVFLDGGRMVNAILLEKGMAHVLSRRPNLKHRSLLLDCQRRAMKQGVGIWSAPPDREASFYVGNRASFRFHRPSCPFGARTAARNRTVFKKRFDAFWQGYSPCKRCGP